MTRPKRRAKIERRCKGCGKSIAHKHLNARFCCQRCKDGYHNLTNPRGYGLRDSLGDLDDGEGLGWDAHK